LRNIEARTKASESQLLEIVDGVSGHETHQPPYFCELSEKRSTAHKSIEKKWKRESHQHRSSEKDKDLLLEEAP
jgi:hypothetical protein